jgi:hypothetical protein
MGREQEAARGDLGNMRPLAFILGFKQHGKARVSELTKIGLTFEAKSNLDRE